MHAPSLPHRSCLYEGTGFLEAVVPHVDRKERKRKSPVCLSVVT
jgi:hypothetical protein